MILNRVENQNSPVGFLPADAPLLEQVNRVALDILAVQSINCYEGDLRVRFFVQLAANVLDLGLGRWVQDVSKVVDVTGRLKLRDGFCLGENARDQQKGGQAGSCASTHSRIVQDRRSRYRDPSLASMASPSLRVSVRQPAPFTLVICSPVGTKIMMSNDDGF